MATPRDAEEWVEYRVTDDQLLDFIHWSGASRYTWHAFYDEPWAPGQWVLRVEGNTAGHRYAARLFGKVYPYDRYAEAQVFGFARDATALEVSRLGALLWAAGGLSPAALRKTVHCFLNAQQLTRWQEFKFHFRAAWGHVMVWIRHGRKA